MAERRDVGTTLREIKGMRGIYHPSPEDRVYAGWERGSTKPEKKRPKRDIVRTIPDVTPGWEECAFFSFSFFLWRSDENAGGYPVKRRCAN